MKVKVANVASQRTRIKIREAYAKLTEEKKSISCITVKELVEKAGITRGTFYTHYSNIYDVAKDFQDEIIDILFKDVDKIDSLDSLKSYLEMIFNHLKNNEELYKMMLASDDPLIFMYKLGKIMNKHLTEFLTSQNIKTHPLDVNFFTTGTICLFIKYFRDELNVSLEELYIYIIEVVKKLFNLKEPTSKI